MMITDYLFPNEMEKERKRQKQEIVNEMQRRIKADNSKIAKSETDTDLVDNLSQIPIDKGERAKMKDVTEVVDTLNNAQQNQGENRVFTAGPYKGMTYADAQDRIAWKQRIDRRISEHTQNLITFTDERLQASRNEESVIFSYFKQFTPQQLENARKHALRILPDEDVNEFFDALKNHSDNRTPEQIAEDANRILDADKTAKIVRASLHSESQAIQQEFKNFYGEQEYKRLQQEIREAFVDSRDNNL